MNNYKFKYVILISMMFFAFKINAQNNISIKDTTLTQKQLDKLYLRNKTSENITKFKNNFTKNWNKIFVDFTDNDVMLVAGMNFSKQNILANDYSSPFIYTVDQKNEFKPGFMSGFRVDGKYKEKYPYAFSFILNKYATGTNYEETKNINPFLGNFSNFKATDQFFIFNISALYKKILPISDTSKYKFYVVAGPSIGFRLSGEALNNQVNKDYRNLFLSGAIGFEFNNKSFYTLFLHYKQGLNSITRSPIQTNLNSFELGMFVKASDLL